MSAFGSGNDIRGCQNYAKPVVRQFRGTQNAGAAATVDGTFTDDFFTSVTDAGSGVYNVVFKPCRRAQFIAGNVFAGSLANSRHFQITSLSATAGTAVFRTVDYSATPALASLATSAVFDLFFLVEEGRS